MAELTLEAIEKRLFDESKPKTVCFVCTGNTCRSPMAAAVLNHIAKLPPLCSMCDIERLLNSKKLRGVSAGLAAFGEPISKNACLALEEASIESTPDNDYKSHTSRMIDEEMMKNAELVVGISSMHAMRLVAMFPQYAAKITSMPEDIPDPYGMDREQYSLCLKAIIKGVESIYDRL